MFESSRSYTTTKTAKMRKTDNTGLGDADSVDFWVNRMLLKWTPITLFGSKPLRFVAFQRLISNCVAGGDSWESLRQQGDQTSQSQREWILNIHWKFSSVAQSCLTLCDPMDCSMPGLPVHHQLPEFTQTHVHWAGDAIQPSHPLSSPSPPAPNPSQHQGLFQWVSSSHEVAKVLEFQLQHQSFQWTPRTDLL